ncbi:MAG: hypothetical protein ABWX73_13550 [Marmoricola sp.]
MTTTTNTGRARAVEVRRIRPRTMVPDVGNCLRQDFSSTLVLLRRVRRRRV